MASTERRVSTPTMTTLDGSEIDLAEYRGRAVLLVFLRHLG